MAVENWTIVTANPAALQLGADTLTCPGMPLVFHAPSTYSSYLWSDGSSNSTITMPAAGIYVCTVTTTDGCIGVDSVVLGEYIVDHQLITAIGSLTTCLFDSLELVGASQHTNYVWSTGETSASIVVVGFGGEVILQADDLHGCLASDTIIVDFHASQGPSPVIHPGPNAFICSGSDLVLDAGAAYFSYEWNTGAVTQVLVTNLPGVYRVTVTNGFGCLGESDPVTVGTATAPTPMIQQGAMELSTTQLYVSYQWYLNNIPLQAATGQIFSPIFSGNYTVTIVDSNGCSARSASYFYNAVGVATGAQSATGFLLYPNPAQDVLHLASMDAIQVPMTIEFWDMFGQKLRVIDQAYMNDALSFDISNLAAGPYLMKISVHHRNHLEQTVLRFARQ